MNGVGRIVSGVWSVWCGVNGVKGWGEGRNRFRWWYWKGIACTDRCRRVGLIPTTYGKYVPSTKG